MCVVPCSNIKVEPQVKDGKMKRWLCARKEPKWAGVTMACVFSGAFCFVVAEAEEGLPSRGNL